MTRDEFYNHLANVYLDKKEPTTKEEAPRLRSLKFYILYAGLPALILAAGVVFLLTRPTQLDTSEAFSLSNSLIKIPYNVTDPYPQVKTFSVKLPQSNLSSYGQMRIKMRGASGGNPGTVKLQLNNDRNELGEYYFTDVTDKWQTFDIKFQEFDITDWTTISDIAFVIEGWNAKKTKGTILIDDISFSN